MPSLTILWIVKNKIIFRRRYYNLLLRPEVEREVKKRVKSMSGEWFVDIGSNRGYYSKLARKRFRHVLSIDPNPRYHARLQIAISDENGQQDFFICKGEGSADSLVKNPHILGQDWKNDGKSVRVETRTFDSLNIDADLVKIDVEGAEFQVLDGMRSRLPKNLLVELHDERREQELVEKIAGKGYNVSKIDPTHFLGEKN